MSETMKIECLVKRPGGSHVELWGTGYHFAPQADGAHVAEVKDADHQDRFLSIREGYRIYRPGRQEKPKAAPAAPVVLKGSMVHPATFEVSGKTVAIDDVVKAALERSGMSPEGWNEQGEEARAELIDLELDYMAEKAGDTNGDDTDREKAAAEYQEKFGKKPHHRWNADKIREELSK